MSTTSLVSRRLIIRPLDGQNQVYDNIPGDATVGHLKERIFVAEGIPVENQKLIYGPEVMDGQSSFKRSLALDAKIQQIPEHSNPTTSVR
jgi:hypothetical protein